MPTMTISTSARENCGRATTTSGGGSYVGGGSSRCDSSSRECPSAGRRRNSSGASAIATSLFLRDPDIPVPQWIAVILEVDWPRLWPGLVRSRRGGALAGQLHVIVDYHAIMRDRDPRVGDEFVPVVFRGGVVDVERLP